MSVHLGAGWRLTHLTDRCIELRKDDAAYRRLTGRDGYVRVRAEPGMDRYALIERGREVAQRQDADLAERVAKQLLIRNPQPYLERQRQLAGAFGTPQDPEIIGRKSA